MRTNTLRDWTLLALAVVSFAVSKVEADAPAYIPIQGYLTSATGEAVDGTVSIRFRLYTSETGGTTLFEETKAEVKVADGVFSVYLGDESSIDLSVFRDHPVVFVGIKLTGDASEMSPRLQLATAPYAAFAQYCGDATTLGGKTGADFLAKTYTPVWNDVSGRPATFAPSAHQHPWSDLVGGVPSGLADGDSDVLGGLSCADGKVVKRSGGAWSCGDDADTDTNTTYTAGTGLSLSGNQFSLAPCTDGQILKRDGSAWTCAPSEDTLGRLTCAVGQVAKWEGAAWTCSSPESSQFYGQLGNVTIAAGNNFILPVSVTGSGSCLFMATAALDDGAATTTPSWLWPAVQAGSGAPAVQGNLGMQVFPVSSAASIGWTFVRSPGVTYKVGCGIVNASSATKARCHVVSYCF